MVEKTVAAFEARRQFGHILQEVVTKGERFVVKRHGEAVAAVVPIEVYQQWKRARGEFFARLRAAAERANLSPEAADALADEAVTTARADHAP